MDRHIMRNNLLEQAWTGPPLTIGGRELVLTWGRFTLLNHWGNPLFVRAPDPEGPPDPDPPFRNDIGEPQAMGEILMTCQATPDELKVFRGMSTDERGAAVLDFMLAHEDELGDAAEGIGKRMKSIEAAGVETDDMGKQRPAAEEARARAV